jgi:hypothetical protein
MVTHNSLIPRDYFGTIRETSCFASSSTTLAYATRPRPTPTILYKHLNSIMNTSHWATSISERPSHSIGPTEPYQCLLCRDTSRKCFNDSGPNFYFPATATPEHQASISRRRSARSPKPSSSTDPKNFTLPWLLSFKLSLKHYSITPALRPYSTPDRQRTNLTADQRHTTHP